MSTHRERLRRLGLYTPFDLDEECRRNGILVRMAEGESFSMEPIWCVFRKDEWDRHIIYDGEYKDRCCQQAELIADKLTSYEARRLVTRLECNDPEQPMRRNGLQLGMYGYATMEDWNKWEREHSQMSFDL